MTQPTTDAGNSSAQTGAEAFHQSSPGSKTTRVYQRGQQIFRVNDRCRAVFVVHSGTVKTVIISKAGEEHIIDFFMPGDVIGLDAIGQGTYASSAIALDTIAVRVIPIHDAASDFGLLRALSAQLARHNNLLLVIGQKNSEQKVASFLLDQSRRHAERGFSATRFTLPMARADIARYLGLAAETASRVFTRLHTRGVLEVARNDVQILDPEQLAFIANSDHAEPITAIH